nr:exodeoxyribonuclease V subunit gamma [Calditrichia bacterium]
MPPKPEFHLHLGAGGPYYFFREGVLRRIPQQGNLSFDFVYLLPVKRAVRFAKEHLIDRSPAGALADPPVFTFYEYMLHLYRRLPDPRKVISPAMRLFLVEEVLQQSLDKLRFFSPTSAGRRGLIRKVDGLLTELREYGYDGDKLLSQIAESESDNRLHDFSLLIDAFNQLLGDQLIDEAGAIQEVVNRLDEAFFRKYMAGVEVIYLNGYGLFSRPMITFFEKIRSFCQVHIQLDYDPTNPDLFQHIALAYEDLMALGPEEVVSHQFQQAGGGWIPRLFSTAGEQAPPVDPGKDILIQPATSRAEEVAFMANYVKRLHRVEGIPLHRIGITFPSLERYAALIRDIFPRHGLPFNLSTGLALNQSPLVRSFLLALEVPLSGFESGRLLQLVSSPFFRPQAYMQVSAPDLKALCRELRITHFSGKWRDHLREQVAYLSRLREEMAGEDELALRDIDLRLNRLQTLEKPLASLLNPFRELARPHGAAAFRDAFLSILRKLNFLDWYKGPVSQLGPQEQEQEFRSFNRFIKLLDQFSWIVTRRHGERSLELNELYQFLKLLVDQATYNLREWDQFGVQVMPRLEILAIEPEVLLFG